MKKGEIKMFEKWMGWSFAEGTIRATSGAMLKVLGTLFQSVSQAFLSTLIIGGVQMTGGLVLSKSRNKTIFTDLSGVLWCGVFGVFAVIATILSFVAFMKGADMGLFVLIISLSIIPGALIDKIFFKHKLTVKQWVGVMVGILAVYSMLNFPSMASFIELPLWIWIAFANMLVVAFNQGVTRVRVVREIDPFVKNFWVGLTTLVLCLIAILIMDEYGYGLPTKFWWGSLIIGLIVIALISTHLMSYKRGGTIAVKSLVGGASYLVMGMVFGFMLFNEPITFGKIAGLFLYLVAFYLMQKEDLPIKKNKQRKGLLRPEKIGTTADRRRKKE